MNIQGQAALVTGGVVVACDITDPASARPCTISLRSLRPSSNP